MCQAIQSRSALFAVLFIFSANARAQDTVVYIDPANMNKEASVTGTIELESSRGIRIKPTREPARDIAAETIREVRYKTKAPSLDYRNALSKEAKAAKAPRDDERKKILAEALQEFQSLLPKVEDNPKAVRYIRYKIADVKGKLADLDSSQLDEAVKLLASFTNDHADGWEIIPAWQQLARLQQAKGDLAAAAESYQRLAAVPGIADRLKQQSELAVVRLLMRANKFADAEKRLSALAAGSEGNTVRQNVAKVYMARCQLVQGKIDQVETALKEALAHGDIGPETQAAGHNALGDFYQLKGSLEDAFWEYLRVDVQYDGDREEAAKALYHLSALFDKVKSDKARAAECRARLLDKSQFGGTEYHKKALAEPR